MKRLKEERTLRLITQRVKMKKGKLCLPRPFKKDVEDVASLVIRQLIRRLTSTKDHGLQDPKILVEEIIVQGFKESVIIVGSTGTRKLVVG